LLAPRPSLNTLCLIQSLMVYWLVPQSGRVVLVYHKPGRASAVNSIRALVKTLRSLGLDCEAVTLEQAVSRSEEYRGKQVYLLMFARGGHWKQLVDAGLDPQIIPPILTATSIGREARRRWGKGCSLALVTLRARRLRELQYRDIEEIRRLLSLYCGTEVVMLDNVGTPLNGKYEYAAPLALLDGKLTETACKPAVKDCLGPFISYALEDLAAWIAWTATHKKR